MSYSHNLQKIINLQKDMKKQRNAMNVINDWITLLEKRKNMVNPDAVIIKLDKDALQTQLVIDKVIKYPIKSDNKVNFLGDDENCIYIKQVTSELKEGYVSNPNDSFEAGHAFRLDKQDSNLVTSYYNTEDLEKYSIFNSQRLSDDQHRGFQFGKAIKNQIKVLENAHTGFSKDFFSVFKNEYSSQFNKNSKYVTQQIYNNKFEKCNLLEDYFSKSFQNTVSFMINERFTTTIDAAIKELPTFEVNIFNAFKNEYSVVTPMHYTFDDSKIKYQPNQIKQKEQQSALNVTDVYTIQGIDTNQASEFMANLITKNEKTPQKYSPSPEKTKKSKNKKKKSDNSPKLEYEQQNLGYQSPESKQVQKEYLNENQNFNNNDQDLSQYHQNSETKNMYEREVHRTDQLYNNNDQNESTNITNSNKYGMNNSINDVNINNSESFNNTDNRYNNDYIDNSNNNDNNNVDHQDNYYSNDNNNNTYSNND